MRHYLIYLFLILALLAVTSSEVFAISDAAVLFLRIAPNARSGGMGEAFVAIADDASATHWNPAGLGEYPLSHAWYEIKLRDDSHLKELAREAFEGKLEANYFEKIGEWEIQGNEISRLDSSEWKTAAKVKIDPTKTILSNLSRRVSTADKDFFKSVARQVCKANTSVSFDDINSFRLKALGYAGNDKAMADSINAMFERMVVFWQDLRFNSDAYSLLKSKFTELVADNTFSVSDRDQLSAQIAGCESKSRPSEIDVPYTVLLTGWQGWDVPWEQRIDKIQVMENNVPTENYTHYDIWALTNFGLLRYNGTTWDDGDNVEPRKGDNLRDIVSRALGTSDDKIINSRLETVAISNNTVSREHVQELVSQIKAKLPENYDGKPELLKNLDSLDNAWLGCTLDQERFTIFTGVLTKALTDSTLSSAELDRIRFSLEKSLTGQMPALIKFPFKAVFTGKINDIAVDHKTIYAATEDGLFKYDGRRWEKYSLGGAAAVPEAVWCVRVLKKGQIWIGTDSGIKVLREGKWTTYGAVDGLSALPIKNIYVKNDKVAWAASDNDLFSYDGTKWSNTFKYTTNVTDSAQSVFSHFYGSIDPVRVETETAKLQLSHPSWVATPKAGEVIDIPFAPVFEGNITAMAMDNDDNLWIGTDLGLKRFDGRTWYSYGYKPIKVDSSMTVEELAGQYLKSQDPDKIAGFVNIIKRKNTLQGGKLPAGKVVYVYANPAGSPIQSLCERGGKIYVASLYGSFSYNGGTWERYYHEGLHQENTKDIVSEAGEMWFATSDEVVVFAQGRKELGFTHAQWLPQLASDLYYEFLSYVQPIGSLGTIGGNVTFLSYGTIQTTGESSSDITGEISPFDVAFTLSYGTRASKSMAIGLSAKVIYSRLSVVGAGREIGQGSGTSFAAEGGILYSAGKKLRLGVVLTNLGPNMSYIDAAQSDALPRNLAVGFAYRLLDSPYNRLTILGEINKLIAKINDSFSTELKEAVENVGMEYWYGSLLALRAGYIYDQTGQIKTPTLGIGLQYKSKYRIDFAYIPSSENLPLANTLRTSLTVKL